MRNLWARIVLVIVGALAITVGTQPLMAAPLHNRQPSLGWLQVKGRFIVDSTGKPFRLLGHGIPPINPGEWYGKTADQIAADYKAKGCNSMRVAFYRNNDYDQTRDQIRQLGYEKFIDTWIAPQVRAVISQGMYAIIDWHGYQNGLDFLYDELIPLWEHIARRYKDEPGVAIYELWNEPVCGYEAGARGLRAWYREAIAAIRAIDRRHVILVSDWNAGWGWAIEPMWAPHGKLIDIDPLRPNQIAYSKHMGPVNEKRGDGKNADDFSRKYNVPVFWGEVETDPNPTVMATADRAEAHEWFRRMVERVLTNRLYQGWQMWRIYLDDFEEEWSSLTANISPDPEAP